MSDNGYGDQTRILRASDIDLTEHETGSDRTGVLTVLRGRRRGSTFQLTSDLTEIGRGETVEIRVDDEGVSRRHAAVRRLADGSLQIEDQGSTNGTFVNGVRVSAQVLKDDDRVALGSTTLLKFELHDAMELKLKAEMYQKATRDALTGLFNRRYCVERLREEYSFAVRHGEPLSVVLFDVDHFKKVNDTYGHAAGDAVLQRIGAVLMDLVRNEDVVCRYGGEEFACILRGQDLNEGANFAERIREAIDEQRIDTGDGNILHVTVSLGVASRHESGISGPEELVNQADAYLYVAKEGGRNRVAHSGASA